MLAQDSLMLPMFFNLSLNDLLVLGHKLSSALLLAYADDLVLIIQVQGTCGFKNSAWSSLGPAADSQ